MHRKNRKPLTPDEQFTVRLPKDILDGLQAVAEREGLSRSDVLRILLRRGLRAGLFAGDGVHAA